jgi:hypothetical protein
MGTWETYREPNQNPLGFFKGNIVRTHWEPMNFFYKNPFPPKLKMEKMQGTLSACLGLPIGCMKFLFPKEFITIFGLGYYPLQTAPYRLMKNLMKH